MSHKVSVSGARDPTVGEVYVRFQGVVSVCSALREVACLNSRTQFPGWVKLGFSQFHWLRTEQV